MDKEYMMYLELYNRLRSHDFRVGDILHFGTLHDLGISCRSSVSHWLKESNGYIVNYVYPITSMNSVLEIIRCRDYEERFAQDLSIDSICKAIEKFRKKHFFRIEYG